LAQVLIEESQDHVIRVAAIMLTYQPMLRARVDHDIERLAEILQFAE
jgi:hypothetical protein